MSPENDLAPLAVILDWDSRFFGKTIGRVSGAVLTPPLVARIDAWAADNRVDCLYFLASADDSGTTRAAENDGYHLVDIRVTLEHRLPQRLDLLEPSPRIRPALEGDIGALRAISRNNHHDSRFYHDGSFDREKCDELYAVWIEKSVRGAADHALVWDEAGQAVAYVTGKLLPAGGGSVELVGVHPGWQGKGIGFHLTRQLLAWFQGQGVHRVTVVTQGRNIGAQVLYQRSGFVSLSTELWYHKWFLNP